MKLQIFNELKKVCIDLSIKLYLALFIENKLILKAYKISCQINSSYTEW